MTLTPNSFNKTSATTSDNYMWSRDGSSTYGLLWTYDNSSYIVYDLSTRTVAYTGADVAMPWSYSTYSGNAIWTTIDHEGTLWGSDASEATPVLLSSANFGQGPVVAHGLFALNDQPDAAANVSPRYRHAFKDNNGNPVIFWSTSWGGNGFSHDDRMIYRYTLGDISNLRPSIETGTAFMPSQQFFQDEYGDVWNVGHEFLGATKAYFWRVFANGSSPITGDLHVVSTGMPTQRPLEGDYPPGSYFNPCWNGKRQNGDFIIWWEGQFNDTGTVTYTSGENFTNGLGSRYYVRVESTSWTVADVKYFDTNLLLGMRFSEARNPETPNSNYLLLQQNYPWDTPDATWEMYDLRDGSFESYLPYFGDWFSAEQQETFWFLDYDLKSSEPAIVVTDYVSELWWIGFVNSGVINPPVPVTVALAGTVADPAPVPTNILTGGHVIDVRGRSDLVILGKSLVLPTSIDDENHSPLDGSIRFNSDTGWPQLYANGAWTDLGGGGGDLVWEVDTNRILGRTSAGVGPVQQLTVGSDLLITANTLSYTVSEEKPPFLTGGHMGTLSANQKVLIGFAPTAVTLSSTNTSARSLVAPIGSYSLAIMRKSTGLAGVQIGSFDWTAGNKLATTTLTDPDLAELDFVYLQGASSADGALANLAFVFRAA